MIFVTSLPHTARVTLVGIALQRRLWVIAKQSSTKSDGVEASNTLEYTVATTWRGAWVRSLACHNWSSHRGTLHDPTTGLDPY